MFKALHAPARSWPVVVVIAFSLFIDYLLYGILLPLAAHSSAGLSGEQKLAWLYGAYAISALVVTPVFGYFGDRMGSRSIVLCGVLLAACAAGLFAVAPNLHMLFLARVCQGAASAALWIGGLATIASHYVERRAEMIGYAFTGSTAGSVLGPMAGGWMSSAGGFMLPFLMVGALLVIEAFFIILVIPSGHGSPEKSVPIRLLLRNRSLAVPALAVALAAFSVGIIEPLLPVRLARAGMTSTTIGLIFTVPTLVYGLSAPVVGWVSERFPFRKVVTLGAIATAATLPLLAAFRQPGAVCAAITLVYVSFAFMLNPASAELGNAVDRAGMSCYSAAYAVYNVVYSAGMLATAALASTAARFVGFPGVLLCIVAVLLACLPLLASTRRPIAIAEASQERALG